MGIEFDYRLELIQVPWAELEMLISSCIPELDELPLMLDAVRIKLEDAGSTAEITALSKAYMSAVAHLDRYPNASPVNLIVEEKEQLEDAFCKLINLPSGDSLLKVLVQYQTFVDCCKDFETALTGQPK